MVKSKLLGEVFETRQEYMRAYDAKFSSKHTARSVQWIRDNPERVHAGWVKRRLKVMARKQGPCADCGGIFPPERMDFDHVRGRKEFGIGSCATFSPRVQQEIEKCDVVCANCHRVRTKARKQSLRLK